SNIAVTVCFEQSCCPDCRPNQGLWGCLAILFQKALIQRATDNADTEWNSRIASSLSNCLHPAIKFLDITGIHANRGAASINRREDVHRLEVNICNNRNWGLLSNRRQCFCINSLRASYPHHVATCSC